jgi:hypothetical protein
MTDTLVDTIEAVHRQAACVDERLRAAPFLAGVTDCRFGRAAPEDTQTAASCCLDSNNRYRRKGALRRVCATKAAAIVTLWMAVAVVRYRPIGASAPEFRYDFGARLRALRRCMNGVTALRGGGRLMRSGVGLSARRHLRMP